MSIYGFQASEEAVAITQIQNDKHQVNNIDGAQRAVQRTSCFQSSRGNDEMDSTRLTVALVVQGDVSWGHQWQQLDIY